MRQMRPLARVSRIAGHHPQRVNMLQPPWREPRAVRVVLVDLGVQGSLVLQQIERYVEARLASMSLGNVIAGEVVVEVVLDVVHAGVGYQELQRLLQVALVFRVEDVEVRLARHPLGLAFEAVGVRGLVADLQPVGGGVIRPVQGHPNPQVRFVVVHQGFGEIAQR